MTYAKPGTPPAPFNQPLGPLQPNPAAPGIPPRPILKLPRKKS